LFTLTDALSCKLATPVDPPLCPTQNSPSETISFPESLMISVPLDPLFTPTRTSPLFGAVLGGVADGHRAGADAAVDVDFGVGAGAGLVEDAAGEVNVAGAAFASDHEPVVQVHRAAAHVEHAHPGWALADVELPVAVHRAAGEVVSPQAIAAAQHQREVAVAGQVEGAAHPD
jgi:hypothetical protein